MPSNAQQLLDLGGQALERARAHGAEQADVLVIESADMNAGVRHGVPETIERAESTGIGLRVFVGQSFATLSTSDTSADALEKLASNAVAIARVASADPFAGLADAAQLATHIANIDGDDPFEPSMDMLQRLARDCEEAGRSVRGIANSEGADASVGRQRIALLTSHGFAQSYGSTHASLACSLIAGEGEAMERDYDYATKVYFTDLPSPESIGQEAARRTLARLAPRKIASQQLPIFFEPRAGRQLLSAFSGAISGSAIARGTSFLKNAMGEAVFADSIRIIDDPLLPRGLGSHPFDAEGIAATKRAMVEGGVLQSWLLDCRSARQLGLQSTGHALRGLSSAPYPAATNLYIEPSTVSPEALYANVPHGLLVTETIGHGTNLITGDFSVGANGFWVENGQVQYPVSEVTIAGNLRDMYRSMQVASDLTFRSSTNVPTILIPSMTLAGN
ncbi:MAG: modulator protein [Azospirillum brasilense]|nr:MAG: modulator protein [Azospirillum brasilense]